MCWGSESSCNKEQKRLSWACPQHPDASISSPRSRSWARLPWGTSHGEGSMLHLPVLLAQFSSQPVYTGGGSFLTLATPEAHLAHKGPFWLWQPLLPSLICSRRTWPRWKPSSLQRESSGTAPWPPRRCTSTDTGSRKQAKGT